jgi:hypothetical protein
MKVEKIVEELVEAAGQLGIRVRKERGSFRGGLCTVDGEEVILLNQRQPVDTHLAILAESLRIDRIDEVFLTPAVRAALETCWASGSLADVEPDDAG